MKLRHSIVFIYCVVLFTAYKKDGQNVSSSDRDAPNLKINSDFSSGNNAFRTSQFVGTVVVTDYGILTNQ